MHRWQAHLLAETARANQAEAHVFQMQKAAQRRAASPTPTANTTKVLIRIIAPISTQRPIALAHTAQPSCSAGKCQPIGGGIKALIRICSRR